MSIFIFGCLGMAGVGGIAAYLRLPGSQSGARIALGAFALGAAAWTLMAFG